LDWTGGTMSGTGRTVAAGSLAISGSADKTLDGRTLDNRGDATLTGAGGFIGLNGATGNNAADGTLLGQSDAGFTTGIFGTALSPVFNNAGTFRKAGGSGTTSVGWVFNNAGTAEVLTGTLDLHGSIFGPFPVVGGTSSGQFAVGDGATLS